MVTEINDIEMIDTDVDIRLYLDDIRMPKNGDWVVVRSFNEAVSYVSLYGMPSYISFDHDLGESDEKTGYDFAKWLVEYDQDNDLITKDFDFNVHSSNPPGAANINGLLRNYLMYKFGE